MDRIRAYVLRKFASTASLEVLRSPTYVEQVQEVIDRAAPIIKEKLEEIGRPRGKRSRSVDLTWNRESLHRDVRGERRHGDYDEEKSGRRKSGKSGLEQKVDIAKKEEMESSFRRNETISNTEREEKKLRRRSAGSGKKSRRRESGDFGVVDQVDDNSKHSNKLEHEFGDTLEARLTATQSILENISKSTSELGGDRDPAENDLESEISDHNVVSLPIVRPPSSRNSRSATKNGSDSLTLPPISPEAPKSTKKKDELSLPVLSVTNGNHSAKKPQEQDISKDAEEASTMHDITSDIEDIAILPENEDAIVNAKQDPANDRQDLTLDVEFIDEEKRMRDEDRIFQEDALAKVDENRGSLEEFEELEELEEGRRSEEVFKDSLNITPEVADVPLRPDSLEPDGDEVKPHDDNADLARENTFDRLKDKLIEIEMAERSIEKALACQQIVTCDIGEMTSQAEKSVIDGKINETREPTNEAEETVSEIRKSTGAEKIIPINKDDEERKKNNGDKKRKSTDDIEETKNVTNQISNKTKGLNAEKRLTKAKKMESEIKGSTGRDETENSRNNIETSANEIKKSATENEAERIKSKAKVLKNEVEKATDQTEIITKATENAIRTQDERSMDKTEKSNEKLLNGIEELTVKVHVENVQSINSKSHDKDSQITEVAEANDDNKTTSKKKTENATNGFSKATTSGNITVKSESSNLPNKNCKTKSRKKRENDKLPVMTPLPLEVPYSYILSEGSPCEIPDSVTTVIIPDRPCSSPISLGDEDCKLESTKQKEELRSNILKEKDEKQEKHGYSMEVFGEYVRPEAAVLPIDANFMRGMKGMKPSQEIVIIHQDLDRIKEEGEEEAEKEDSERKEMEGYREKKNDEETVKEEEIKKVVTLEDIVEHEEIEEIDIRTIGYKDAEEISSGVLEHEFLSDTRDLTVDLTNEERVDVAIEFRTVPENSSEECGSSQGTHTTTSSDVKESTVSNQSIESPCSKPIVPELNLDSLQDNTVSSFKMTANGTEKENNGSPRESDATTSLIEPLTSDERLNRLALIDNEEEIVAEELTEKGLRLEVPEVDQLYRAEHAEYEWLGKDPLSTEINLEDEAKYQDNIGSKALSKDAVQIDPISHEKEEAEELSSEEEIARELIDLLDKDMQFHEKLAVKKDSGEFVKSNLDVDDKTNQLLSTSMHSMSVEQEKKDHEDSLDKDAVIKTETTIKSSNKVADSYRDNKDKKSAIINKETGRIKLELTEEAHIENSLVAPLAQFEQDELLEENNKLVKADETITIESKPDIINADYTDIQEKLEDKQINVEEVPESQNNNSCKIEEQNRKRKEDEQEKLQSQEKEKLEVHEEREQKKLIETHEKCKQEKLDNQEEIEQEKLKIQYKSEKDEENIKMEEEIRKEEESMTIVSLEVTECRKDSMKNDNDEEIKLNTESITDDRAGKDAENKKEEKIEDLLEKIESVHGPITSAISEQSAEDCFRFKYWTTETKSSTVETVIEAFDSNMSTDEKMEIVADVPEIVTDESLVRKKDDFHSAVKIVKIQACE